MSGTKMDNSAKYSQLVALFKGFRKKQLGLLFVCMISLITEIYLIFQVQGLIDGITQNSNLAIFRKLLTRIIVTGIFSFILSTLQMRIWHYFRNELMNNMRMQMLRQIFKKKPIFFDAQSTGNIASGVMNDGMIIAQNAGISVLMLILNSLHLIIVFGIFLYRQIAIGLFVFVLSGIYFALATQINGSMRKKYADQQGEYANLNQSLLEKIKGINEIKTLCKEEFFAERFSKQIKEKYFPAVKKVIRLEVEMTALNSVMKVLLPVAVICFGAWFYYQGKFSIGNMVLCYVLVGQLIQPLQNLGDFYQGKQMALGSAERVYDYLFVQENGENIRKTSLINADEIVVDIKLYKWKDKVVLKQFKEKIQKGDIVFIQGESGSGKSTLLKLISNLYDLENGSIFISGQNVAQIDKESLYTDMAILFQESLIFEGTVMENLTLGDQVSQEDIEEVLEIAQLQEFVQEYGLEHQLLENGRNLSGGQKQRICLARILLRHPKILLLDEGTSALDASTENKILDGLKTYILRQKGILLAVSHSDAFARICNQHWKLPKYDNEKDA